MSLRKGHGAGAGVPRIEVKPWDEQAQPDPSPESTEPVINRVAGKVADSVSAKALGRLGGLKKAEHTRILAGLGLVKLGVDHKFYAYEAAGQAFAEKHISTLASMFDGMCAEGPISIVKTAGIQISASRFLYDIGKQSGDAKMLGEASRLGDASRQSILAAYELQSRESAARKLSSRTAHGLHGRADLYEDETKK